MQVFGELPTTLRAYHGTAIQLGSPVSLRFLEMGGAAMRVVLLEVQGLRGGGDAAMRVVLIVREGLAQGLARIVWPTGYGQGGIWLALVLWAL